MPDQIQTILKVLLGIGSPYALLMLALTFYKDHGQRAKQTHILEDAKARMEFWRSRLSIQKEILPSSEFKRVVEEATRALEDIKDQTNYNLSVLAWRPNPIPIPGLPRWRRAPAILSAEWRGKYAGRATFQSRLLAELRAVCALCIHIPEDTDFILIFRNREAHSHRALTLLSDDPGCQ